MTGHPVHAGVSVGIISWDGMDRKADAIAAQAVGVADAVVVIHSDAADSRPEGAGRWMHVPQALFFGQKFAVLLEAIPPDRPLLLIQADAQAPDWAPIIRRFAEVLSARPSLGLWVPRIDNTAFPLPIVARGAARDGLIGVMQTDAIVLGLAPPVVAHLATLDYGQNNLGWGIDWAAVGFCDQAGLEVLCDLTRSVHHPRARGYSSAAADEQMDRFLGQLDPDQRAAILRLKRQVLLQAQRRYGRSHVETIPNGGKKMMRTIPAATLDLPPPGLDLVLVLVQHQRIVLSLPEGTEAHALLPDGTRLPARPRPEALPLPMVLSFAETPVEGVSRTLVTGGAWSCPGQSTHTYTFRADLGPVRVDLIDPVELPPELGDVHLRMGAAVHRADADLLVEWHDAVDHDSRGETWIKLDRQFTGRREDADYQKIDVRIPGSGGRRLLRVRLCYWSHDGGTEPPVVLCTRPYLVSTAQAMASGAQSVMIGDGPIRGSLHEIVLPATDGTVQLWVNGTLHPVLSAPDTAARLELQDGRLMATSDSYAQYSLVINDRPTRLLWVGPEGQELAIEGKLLHDPAARIDLRDPTGNIICARFVPVPGAARRAPAAPAEHAAARHPDAWAIDRLFDADFYCAGFAAADRPEDPASHYLTTGWREGRDPTPWFSTWHYLAMHPDVAAEGMNPFLHYCVAGEAEGRALPQLGRTSDADVFAAHAFAVAPGPHFEEFDPTIGVGRRKRAKVLAYYLPQFHPVPVNDRQWGKGFTEWRQLPRALPRFKGHIQPRIPRDLGYYSLHQGDAMRRQIEMAKAAGLFGFCFYHYWFDGQRVLETPIERLLADPTLDFPFCLMWANENWTRTWDGSEGAVILRQTYREDDDIPFIDDVARHMKDPRYIRIGERPLFFIYRPGHIPNSKARLAEWREIFRTRHGLVPLIFNAQAFGDNDPRVFGLDGAIEFPPHKVCENLPPINATLTLLDPAYRGNVIDYDAVVARSCAEVRAEFPLIRTVVPTWDNEPRRPGRGMVLQGSTPAKFGAWVSRMLDFAEANPVHGESFICVNAWNEWAEAAVLEPDVHHGAAYLNALSRAVHNAVHTQAAERTRLVLVGHDAHPNGAQMLAMNIGQILIRTFGIEVSFVLGGDGPLLERYRALGEVHVIPDPAEKSEPVFGDLARRGFRLAITNATPSGRMVPALKAAGLRVVSLIHELPNLLKSYRLQDSARSIAQLSDHVIFPAPVVRDGFIGFAGAIAGEAEIFPQGLYNTRVLDTPRGDNGLRAELGLPRQTRIVLGVGYADLRKGIDRFVAAGLSLCAARSDVAFLWVGAPAGEAQTWFQPEIDASGLGDRFRILGHRDDVARFFAAADAFYLSSREDPFPSVVLEALAAGLPVIGHEGCGGCDDLIRRHGVLVPQDNPLAVVPAILDMLETRDDRAAQARRAEVEQNYDFPGYVFGLLQRLNPDLPALSAVIPNYNYADYIGERLRSVFDQTLPLREVVVLDDASSDDSVARIRDTAQAAGRTIALHVNATNSGSPFAQWRKGVELAKGDYVWIAEADDLADPTFAARLIDRMRAAGSVLGFTDSRQIDQDGAPLGDSYRPYVNQIEPGAFDAPFDMDGPEFLARFLAVKNVILNVSGVIFHRQSLLDAFRAVGDELQSYNVAGDWRLYVELCARPGSRVSYLPEPLNTHRRHRVSVTHALKVEKHLAEIEGMHRLVAELAAVNAQVRALQISHYEACRAHLSSQVGPSQEGNEN